MIDLGLSKLALIGVVALVVIGPEKLPRVARMAGSLLGRAQRYLNQVKAEVSREIELEELRKMQQEVQHAAENMEQSIAQGLSDVRSEPETSYLADRDFTASRSAESAQQMAGKARDFRRKKLVRSSSVPQWFKQQSAHRTRVISAAARVARYRPSSASRSASRFFH
ncbi:MAG: tatB [Paucimonas sp.]|jgi:sec-independent protein translocase protein TatB|nr:tatB [Paucimonas sp.]